MEAEGNEIWVLEAMDFLWFHQIILFPKTPSQSHNFSFKNSFSQISNHEISSSASATTSNSQVHSSSEESDDHNHLHKEIKRLRLNHHVSRKTRYSSSSPTPKSDKINSRKLEKTMSLGDLELEEVKGFMDLGFIFKKENLSRKMMRLIPGLKRLISAKYEINDDQEIMRPYLSEAWVVKRPNYPLMEVGFGGDCSALEMKKKLKFWARNVALAVHEEL